MSSGHDDAFKFNSVAEEQEAKRDQFTHKEDFGLLTILQRLQTCDTCRQDQTGGGIGKYPYAWAALSAVIMGMSVFGHV
jgi:hypothetical protein